jgi:hypothetical protein
VGVNCGGSVIVGSGVGSCFVGSCVVTSAGNVGIGDVTVDAKVGSGVLGSSGIGAGNGCETNGDEVISRIAGGSSFGVEEDGTTVTGGGGVRCRVGGGVRCRVGGGVRCRVGGFGDGVFVGIETMLASAPIGSVSAVVGRINELAASGDCAMTGDTYCAGDTKRKRCPANARGLGDTRRSGVVENGAGGEREGVAN